MEAHTPSFEITHTMVSLVAGIAEMTGRLDGSGRLASDPVLRRANRLRAVHGSLALEGSALTLEQVTDLFNGKEVTAPPAELEAAKNMLAAYEQMERFDPCSAEDLLAAHGLLLHGSAEAGAFRTSPAGIVDERGRVLRFGSLPRYIPDMTAGLLRWAGGSEVHPLLRSCVVPYVLERIAPFPEGNGCVERLWQTRLLAKWNPLFAWVPVEAWLCTWQKDYRAAIEAADRAGEAGPFILFMLTAILGSLAELRDAGATVRTDRDDRDAARWKSIEQRLRTEGAVMNADVRELCGVSAATANRILSMLVAEGRLQRSRKGGHWAYTLPAYRGSR